MRKNSDFISAFMDYTENTESPKAFRKWSAIACVASVLERRVYFNWGHTTIFPNLYTVFIAPSGARKAEPVTVARDLLQAAGVKLCPERITDEALIRLVAESESTFQGEDKRINFQCAVTVLGEELAVLLRSKDICFLADLTALYDCRDDWGYKTKGSGEDEIKGGCLNLLLSSAPDWLPSILPVEAVGGGFTSRCFFIVEEGKGKTVADPNLNMPSKKEEKALVHDLRVIHSLIGQFSFSPAAYRYYIDWYEEEDEKAKTSQFHIKDPKLSGYVTRRATHIKKLSMCLTASRSDELVIGEGEIKTALEIMEAAENSMSNAFRSIGRSHNAAVLEQVLGILRREGRIEKSELMRMVQRDLDFADFAQIELALEAMDYIDRVIRPDKPTVFIFKG